MLKRSDKGISAEQAMSSFEREIVRQEDIIYGAALFFECLNLLHSDQPSVVETHRKHFRNIIQKGREATESARAILEDARRGGAGIEQISQFRFNPCEGHSNPGEMVKRAEALVGAYNRIFPDRPRSREFTEEETLRLLEEAGSVFKS